MKLLVLDMPFFFRLLSVFFLCIATAAKGNTSGIYSCTDSSGRKITSDRPISACLDTQQRVLNKDGSARTVMRPRLSQHEQLLIDEANKEKLRVEQALKAQANRNLMLLQRYPNENSHNKVRQKSLEITLASTAQTEKRINSLKVERRKLFDSAAKYKNNNLPAELRTNINNNNATLAANLSILIRHKEDAKRINKKFDAELMHLRELWSASVH